MAKKAKKSRKSGGSKKRSLKDLSAKKAGSVKGGLSAPYIKVSDKL